MLIFLDTEFTCLPGLLLSTRPGAGPLNTRTCQEAKLISLAMVSEDGKRSFYGEIERGEYWDWTDCSDFVMTDVLPLLKGGEFTMSPAQMKADLLAWLQGLPGDQTIACDSQKDVDLIKTLLGQDWPGKLNKKIYDLRPALNDEFDRAFVATLRERGGSEHNALDDAWGNRAGWLEWRRMK